LVPTTSPTYILSLHDALPISLMLWNKAGGRVVQGLVNRRRAESALIFRGVYPDGVVVIGTGPVSSPTYGDPETIRGYQRQLAELDRKSTRLNSSHVKISYAVF